MKKSLFVQSLAAVSLALVLVTIGCKEDKTYELQTLTAGTADLNGATSAAGVDPKADIVATFSEGIDAATATSANITLTRDYDNTVLPTTITVSGRTVTINPDEDLGTGTLYKLSFSNLVKYADGEANVTAFERTFTSGGVFAPPGAIAYWTFEDNADDQIGTWDPTAEVAVTYTASRNATAGKAATFDGDASIIEIPNGDLLMNTNDFTLSFWVKTNSNGHVDAGGNPAGHFVMGLGAFYGFQFEIFGNYAGCKHAMSFDNGSANTIAEDFIFNGDGKTKDNGGWQGFTFSKDLTASGGVEALLKDKWAHVVSTYNSATKEGVMYINGEKVKSYDFDLWPDGDPKKNITVPKYGGVSPEVENELAFGFIQSRAGTLWDTETWGGYDFSTANHFKGQLDDVLIYHRVLTEDEIRLMYNSGK